MEIEECLNGFAYKISQFKDIAARKFNVICAFLFQFTDVSVVLSSFSGFFPAQPGLSSYLSVSLIQFFLQWKLRK